ncbi:hypothetical protein ACIBTV_27165 [Micromonospora sp. NPDC049366]|uniref:hypothetical protein n=1 Tax=Micromonospora sp. NPDC049366 TaxID=3364271 RepID=UPI0037A08C01
MDVERGEPIRIWEHPGARRTRRWQSGHTAASDCVHVAIGQLPPPDGRWFAERGIETRAYGSEAAALVVAERLRAGRDDWREVPAEVGADLQPPGWHRSGQNWMPDEAVPPS